MRLTLCLFLLTISRLAAGQTPPASTTLVANKPKTAPNQHLGSPDAMADPEMNLRLNALNGSGTAPLIWRVDTRYEGLRGTPYFLPNWSNGQIELLNGRRFTNVPIKFDSHRQELILLRPKQGNDSIIIDRQTVNQFRLANADGQEYLFRRYTTLKTNEPPLNGGYFLVLYEGKTALLKRVTKSIQNADYKAAYSSGIRYDSFADANVYYILKSDQTITKVKLSKRSLLDALDDKSDALKSFADKLGFKTENDAVTLVQQYDTL
ncbi:hypothetical protein [Spirosoma areae]